MFIQTEPTPNPATLKFLPGKPVLNEGTAEFIDGNSAEASPLAYKLLQLDGISGVFFGKDFITVTKINDLEWQSIKPMILGAIMDHYNSGQPILLENNEKTTSDEFRDDDVEDAIINQIKELIETRVRPAVAQDGGDIVYKGFKKGTVYLHMRGACAGCPSSTMTLKNGIETMLKHYVPEVLQVEAIA
ncbi:MAG: NifU family protein [Rhodospirillaceae bacterium]|nr:NifU family protein [Rhodospirillaceae bacterium]